MVILTKRYVQKQTHLIQNKTQSYFMLFNTVRKILNSPYILLFVTIAGMAINMTAVNFGCNIIIARFNLHRYFCTIIYLYEDTSGLDKTASFCMFCLKGEYISTHLTLLASDDNSFITFTIKHLMK